MARATIPPVKLALRVNDLLFVNEYLRNGGNGTHAYLSIHPHAKADSARANAPAILAKASVQAELAARVRAVGGVTKDFIESSLLTYKQRADAHDDYIAGASICMDAAKLAGLITEKREVKSVSDDESTAIRALVRSALKPMPILPTSIPPAVDALPSAPVPAEPERTN